MIHAESFPHGWDEAKKKRLRIEVEQYCNHLWLIHNCIFRSNRDGDLVVIAGVNGFSFCSQSVEMCFLFGESPEPFKNLLF